MYNKLAFWSKHHNRDQQHLGMVAMEAFLKQVISPGSGWALMHCSLALLTKNNFENIQVRPVGDFAKYHESRKE